MTVAQADVVVPVYKNVTLTEACVKSVLQHSGPSLRRLILVEDASPEPSMKERLARLRLADARVVLLSNAENRGFVSSVNRGVSICEHDVVVLNADTEVTKGWLAQLLKVFASDAQIAAVSPLSNNAAWCSVPTFNAPTEMERLRGHSLGLSRLPAFTEMPTCVGFCMLMRRTVLREIGLFDPKYGRGYNEENDWCQRARAEGYRVGRANRAMVFHVGQVSFKEERERLDLYNARRLLARYPRYLDECRAFVETPAARAAAEHVAARLRLKGTELMGFEAVLPQPIA